MEARANLGGFNRLAGAAEDNNSGLRIKQIQTCAKISCFLNPL
jgi:hypothetical protein